MNEDQLTGASSLVYLVDGSAKMLPEVRIQVDTPYFTGLLTALCMREPLYDLIVGNISGVSERQDRRIGR